MNDARRNPWLDVPAHDYEAHMSDATVGQLPFLSRVFREALAKHRPEHLAILGCTTGTGFEHIDPAVTKRIVGIDINDAYLDVARRRFSPQLLGLELICSDVLDVKLEPCSIDLIAASLFFEYVDPPAVLHHCARWLRPGGVLATVLQLPCDASPAVSTTAITSVRCLEPIMRLVSPERFATDARKAGFTTSESRTETLASGKPFQIMTLRRDVATPQRKP
jgi:ubiquinone/menaquinone biosynthesis C-methylase UbiE